MATILVLAEDDVIARALREHFEVTCLPTDSGPRVLQGRLPDAFVVAPSSADALALVEYLSQHTGRPIVVLAQGASSELIAAYLERGADAVVRDGDAVAECVARLRSLTRRSALAQPSETAYRFGGVELYPERRSVLREGVALHFTRTEFNLLCVLAQHLDTVLSHRQLMSEVWGQEFLSARHYLRVYVRRVREKIEVDPNSPQLLMAYRAKGYMLRSTPASEPLHAYTGDEFAHRTHGIGSNARVTTYVSSLV
ncbi:MAG: response regulator transcription factor [Dehalococcoidia bacterium]|nr:response regulator transcription factor [Dehalococcoidia bacterium]